MSVNPDAPIGGIVQRMIAKHLKRPGGEPSSIPADTPPPDQRPEGRRKFDLETEKLLRKEREYQQALLAHGTPPDALEAFRRQRREGFARHVAGELGKILGEFARHAADLPADTSAKEAEAALLGSFQGLDLVENDPALRGVVVSLARIGITRAPAVRAERQRVEAERLARAEAERQQAEADRQAQRQAKVDAEMAAVGQQYEQFEKYQSWKAEQAAGTEG